MTALMLSVLFPETASCKRFSAVSRTDAHCKTTVQKFTVPIGWQAARIAISFRSQWLPCGNEPLPESVFCELTGPKKASWTTGVYPDKRQWGTLPKTLPSGTYTIALTTAGGNTTATLSYELEHPAHQYWVKHLNEVIRFRNKRVEDLTVWRNAEIGLLNDWYEKCFAKGGGKSCHEKYQDAAKKNVLKPYQKELAATEQALIEAKKKYNNAMIKMGIPDACVPIESVSDQPEKTVPTTSPTSPKAVKLPDSP